MRTRASRFLLPGLLLGVGLAGRRLVGRRLVGRSVGSRLLVGGLLVPAREVHVENSMLQRVALIDRHGVDTLLPESMTVPVVQLRTYRKAPPRSRRTWRARA
eukprot:15368433-Heterocapsa_arctica.AAC.1